MKLISLTTVVIFVSKIAFCQKSAVTLDVRAMFRSKLGLAYEHAFTEAISGRIKFEHGTYGSESTFAAEGAYRLRGIAIIPEFRYYPLSAKQPAPKGFFLAAFGRLLKFEESFRDASLGVSSPNISKGIVTNLGLDLGYKFVMKRICIELMLAKGIGWVRHESVSSAVRIPLMFDDALTNQKKYSRIEVIVGYLFRNKTSRTGK